MVTVDCDGPFWLVNAPSVQGCSASKHGQGVNKRAQRTLDIHKQEAAARRQLGWPPSLAAETPHRRHILTAPLKICIKLPARATPVATEEPKLRDGPQNGI
jgi:hypothetical protein